ncbi:MAG TPA: ribulose-phosphate 3-epimerase [Thermoflexia bacterium]|nr:ribulose-phosphate 3-epimerase [Thermoflexia bacterium]
MSKWIRIAPSILAADFTEIGLAVRKAEAAGADLIHIDVMDGQFVPNISIGPSVVKAIRQVTTLPLDVHLMIDRPERYLTDFVRAGADWVSVHPEATTHLHRTLCRIKELGAKAGVALNPATGENVLQYLLPELDLILVMTVNPGFGGQKFITGMLPKIRRLRSWLDENRSEVWLSVDGGINVETTTEVVAAGADMLVAGSAIFRYPLGIAQAIADLRDAAERE